MLSIYAALLRDAAEAPEKTAVSDDAASLTRRAFVARISGLAHALPESARVIGLLAPNGVDWAAAQLACAFAGKELAGFIQKPFDRKRLQAKLHAVLTQPR